MRYHRHKSAHRELQKLDFSIMYLLSCIKFPYQVDNQKVDADKTSKLGEKLKELQTIFEYGYTS